MKLLLTTFVAIFLAELADKTQIATLLFASGKDVNRLHVFFGASLALICTSAIAVLVGKGLSEFASGRTIKVVAGSIFILIGIWTLLSK